jgi:Protein of unknown function (DUF1569)
MHRYLEQTSVVVEEALSGMTEEQLLAARETKWSAAQILEHLALAFGATATKMESIAAADELDVRRPTLRDRIVTMVVCRLEHIPSGRKAPGYTVPSAIGRQDALRKLHDNLTAMDTAITRVEQKWGNRLVGVHPVLGPLDPDQWRKFHMVHARHHARQILAIKAVAQASARAAS